MIDSYRANKTLFHFWRFCSALLISNHVTLCFLDDPQDAVVAQMYKNDMEAFKRKAAEWTQNYAKEVTMDDKVAHLMEMGFAQEQCQEALDRANGD